ncbi:MAG: hypothetical protein WEA77_04240, partial [Hyphomonas sp.]|uniref:hypothetical protein n=1 Tax=Hyphomonas sp. TaxID=87 RepID=UPI00349FD2CE
GRRRELRRARRREKCVGLEIVRDTYCMAEDRRLDVALVIDVNPAHELDQLTGLGALIRSFCVNRLTDQMKSHRIISHFRCALIPQNERAGKHFCASEMRDNTGEIEKPACRSDILQGAMTTTSGENGSAKTARLVASQLVSARPCHSAQPTIPELAAIDAPSAISIGKPSASVRNRTKPSRDSLNIQRFLLSCIM